MPWLGLHGTRRHTVQTGHAATIGGEQIRFSARNTVVDSRNRVEVSADGPTDGRTSPFSTTSPTFRANVFKGSRRREGGAGTHSAHYSTGGRTTTSPRLLQDIKRRGDSPAKRRKQIRRPKAAGPARVPCWYLMEQVGGRHKIFWPSLLPWSTHRVVGSTSKLWSNNYLSLTKHSRSVANNRESRLDRETAEPVSRKRSPRYRAPPTCRLTSTDCRRCLRFCRPHPGSREGRSPELTCCQGKNRDDGLPHSALHSRGTSESLSQRHPAPVTTRAI
ncbi:uncharacterized protein J3D65DRAFT_284649 [Phyllosticta citribraziliensis]|uniref:Uncharacterized protein n=1 Tax=Phyllosticta citribraziliensis TaxID=989973 RepID=A0ABR1LWL0_9PEZI